MYVVEVRFVVGGWQHSRSFTDHARALRYALGLRKGLGIHGVRVRDSGAGAVLEAL